MKLRMLVLVLALAAAIASPRRAHAEPGPAPIATYAFIIGSNYSVDANLPPLRYADDDAARYLDLFRLVGARTYLLTRLDENTRRLHPQAAAEALNPRKAAFEATFAQLVADVSKANARGVETLVYFVFAGHGNVHDGEGYITLEDMRLTGADLARLFAPLPAKRIHVIADACGSYFLAYGRGPGGERRPLDTLSLGPALLADARVGLLLSTSSARESHEWDGFQAGVFSHEVRSGLYGAADADGDGQVSYREIAAFVARANATIPNERYRPDVHALAPRTNEMLFDLRHVGRRVTIDGKHAGHYLLEDARGVRVADVHNAPDQTLSLARPLPPGRLYVRRAGGDEEFVVEAHEEAVALADLTPHDAPARARGAAHEAFGLLFELPFDRGVVDAYRERDPERDAPPPAAPPPAAPPRRSTIRRTVGVAVAAAGAVTLGAGAYFSIAAHAARGDLPRGASQFDIARANDRIHGRQTAADALYVGGGVAVATGLALALWPSSSSTSSLKLGALPGGGFAGYGASF